MNVDETVNYIMAHRKNKVFKGRTSEQIRDMLVTASFCRSFVFTQDNGGALVGVLVADPRPEQKELFIRECLTTAKGALASMLGKFYEWYPGWRITAMRRGKYVEYDTPRLCHLLEKIA